MLQIGLLDYGFRAKGVYNKAPIFNIENYVYWKDCMLIHINSIDRKVWIAIQNGSFEITIINEDGVVVPKPEAQWDVEDEKKWYSDWKARNVLISVSGVNEYYRVSHCETAKAMREALQISMRVQMKSNKLESIF